MHSLKRLSFKCKGMESVPDGVVQAVCQLSECEIVRDEDEQASRDFFHGTGDEWIVDYCVKQKKTTAMKRGGHTLKLKLDLMSADLDF